MHKFIFLEGCSGTGKSTLSNSVKEYLDCRNVPTKLLKYPTDFLKDKIQMERHGDIRDPLLEAYLFATDFRYLLLKHVFIERMDTVFVLDRSYVTSCADSNYGGVNIETVLSINKLHPRPDILFLLDCSPEIMISRISKREIMDGKKKSKTEDLEYLKELRRRYLLLIPYFENTVLVDSDRPIDKIFMDLVVRINQTILKDLI